MKFRLFVGCIGSFVLLVNSLYPLPAVANNSVLSFDFKNGEVEQGFDDWFYADKNDNPCYVYNGLNQSKLCSKDNFRFFIHYIGYNTAHRGYARYGYIDADADFSVKDGALKVVQTGGVYPDHAGNIIESGQKIKSKSDLENADQQNLYSDRALPGILGLNYKTSSSTTKIPALQGMNRLTLWLYLPNGVKKFEDYNAEKLGRPNEVFTWYPFIGSSKGAHYYHLISNLPMGGWIKVQFDANPSHKNTGSLHPYHAFGEGGTEYPGDGVSYFSNIASFAFAPLYMQNTKSPSSYYLDEVKSHYTPYENEETANNLAIGFNPYEKQFDISLEDKYRCEKCGAKYELRYAFSPINNANFSQAKRVAKVVNFDRRDNNDKGQLVKPHHGYNRVWAAFHLQPEDQQRVIPGNTIYFAVKDISDRSQIKQDSVDLEKVLVPGLGAIRKVDLVKTVSYPIIDVDIPLQLDNLDLNQGMVGQKYQHKFDVYGGKPPYVFSTQSRLPQGVLLSPQGELTGEPKEKGAFSLVVKVSDSEANAVSQNVDIEVISLVDLNAQQCRTIVDFSELSYHSGIVDSNYSKIIKDVYTGSTQYGSTIVVGSNASYNYQGVQGKGINLPAGDKIRTVWFNDSDESIQFTPLISFTKNDRPSAADTDNWFYMEPIVIKPKEFKVSNYVISNTLNSLASIINVAANYGNNQALILNKIELVSDTIDPSSVCIMPALEQSKVAKIAIDFNQSNVLSIMDIPQWQSVIKDTYTNYLDEGVGITIGSNRYYNHQGVGGENYLIKKGTVVRAHWINKGKDTIQIKPKLSFEDQDRVHTGYSGIWFEMTDTVIAPMAKGETDFMIDQTIENEYKLININSDYDNNSTLILDKIELLEIDD